MANLIDLMEGTEEKFFQIRDNNTAIPVWVEMKVFCDNEQKNIYKIAKSNDIVEKLSEGIHVTIIFNENILLDLPEDMQEMVIMEALHGIVVDDNDKLKVEKPDFTTHTGILKAFGDESVIQMKESIKSLYDAKKQREDEEKARIKEEKKKKGRQITAV